MANRPQTRRCPNCGANNPLELRHCAICRTALVVNSREQAQRLSKKDIASSPTAYDFAEGEDDLLLRRISDSPLGTFVGLVLLVLGILAAVGAFLALKPEGENNPQTGGQVRTALPTVSNTPAPTALPTNTRPAPLFLPTITPLPATPTPTATEGPCIKTAGPGDTVYGLAQQCGHRHLSIVDVIIAENPALTCSACLQEGQTIEIPWPTATPGGEDESGGFVTPAGDTASLGASGGQEAVAQMAVNQFGTPDSLATLFVEPTLRPGLMWHTIGEGENLIIVASTYGADAKVLSDINPEIDFGQCDFSSRYGGPQCNVILIPGQRMRVPAPTPTPTLPPTLSGSETPTPTPTATFNVPLAYLPPEDAEFNANSLVTLRWSASGTLGVNESYLITVTNLDTDDQYHFQTRDLFYVLPDEVQPTRRRTDEFEWVVSIAAMDGTEILATREQTEPRHFFWQGRS